VRVARVVGAALAIVVVTGIVDVAVRSSGEATRSASSSTTTRPAWHVAASVVPSRYAVVADADTVVAFAGFGTHAVVIDAKTGKVRCSLDSTTIAGVSLTGNNFFTLSGAGLAPKIVTGYDGNSCQPIWTRQLGGALDSPAAVDGEALLVEHGRLKGPSRLAAVDVVTGRVLWQHLTSAGGVAADGITGADVDVVDGPQIDVVDRRTGRARASVAVPPYRVFSTGVVLGHEGRDLLVQSDKIIERVRITGRAIWTFPIPSEFGGESFPDLADGVIVLSDPSAGAEAISASTGHTLWTGKPAVGNLSQVVPGAFLAGVSGQITAYAITTGRTLWVRRVDGLNYARLAADGDVLITDGTTVVAVNLATGATALSPISSTGNDFYSVVRAGPLILVKHNGLIALRL
jgi:outer membrane protein assembly factor BamB